MSTATTIAKHAISLYVCNHSGVLARIALIFTKRGYNIDSLVVSPGQNPHFSWMSIEASGESKMLKLMLKQLEKLVDVIQVKSYRAELVNRNVIERELAMFKIACNNRQRLEILETLRIFRAEVIDLTADTLTCQVTGSTQKIMALQSALTAYLILEVVRTGKVIIERGAVSEPNFLDRVEPSENEEETADWQQYAIQE